MESFRFAVAQNEINTPYAALLLAKGIAYPELDVQVYLDELDDIAESAESALPSDLDSAELAVELLKYLRSRGFHGNATDYYDPRNSFLNDVLERQTGIPISLAILYISLARRLDLNAYGIGLPGHFIVGVGDLNHAIYIDLFNNRRLTGKDCIALVRDTTGFTGTFRTEWLQPVDERLTLVRLLNNLRILYMQRQAWREIELTLRHLEILQPAMNVVTRDRGLVAYAKGEYLKAGWYLESYLEQEPMATDAEALRAMVGEKFRDIARLN